MASPFQNTQQCSVIDPKDPKGGPELANFFVKSFAKIINIACRTCLEIYAFPHPLR
jgi:hypothetical protein